MGDVISLAEHQPHCSGEAACIACGNRWAATGPVGVSWFECPQCGLHKGTYFAPCEPEWQQQVWTCDCGNTVFQRFLGEDQQGWVCAACGVMTCD